MIDKCKSEYLGYKCDAVIKAPHTHHAQLDERDHIWWSDSDEIAELKEKFQNLLDSNPELKLT